MAYDMILKNFSMIKEGKQKLPYNCFAIALFENKFVEQGDTNQFCMY